MVSVSNHASVDRSMEIEHSMTRSRASNRRQLAALMLQEKPRDPGGITGLGLEVDITSFS